MITNEEDPHVDIVVPLLGTNVFRVNTEKILESFRYYANISNHQTSEVYFENVLGEKLFLNQVTSIWYRRPEKPFIQSNLELDEVRIGESWGGLYHFLHSMNNVPWMGHPFEDGHGQQSTFRHLHKLRRSADRCPRDAQKERNLQR